MKYYLIIGFLLLVSSGTFAHDSCGELKGKMIGSEGRVYFPVTEDCNALQSQGYESVGCFGPVTCKHNLEIIEVRKRISCGDQTFLIVKAEFNDGRGNSSTPVVIVDEADIIDY